MKAMDGDAHLRAVAERQRILGITEDDIAQARNPGDRRTPEKRELLRRIQERARAAGLEPLIAYY
jgi:hypothetical protein